MENMEAIASIEARHAAITHAEILAARARAQTSFSAAVIARVVRDLEARKEALVAALQGEVPALETRSAQLRETIAAAEQRITEIAFRIDEIALRTAIGEIEGGGEEVLRAEHADVQHALDAARAEHERVEDLLGRCAQRQQNTQAIPADRARPPETLEALSAEDDPWSLEEDLSPAGYPSPLVPEPEHALIVFDEGGDSEQQFEINGSALTIGRGNGNDLKLRGDSKVSRRHLSVFRDAGLWWLEDHHSANGTLVNGELISGRRRLYGGEEIIVGETFLRFHRS